MILPGATRLLAVIAMRGREFGGDNKELLKGTGKKNI